MAPPCGGPPWWGTGAPWCGWGPPGCMPGGGGPEWGPEPGAWPCPCPCPWAWAAAAAAAAACCSICCLAFISAYLSCSMWNAWRSVSSCWRWSSNCTERRRKRQERWLNIEIIIITNGKNNSYLVMNGGWWHWCCTTVGLRTLRVHERVPLIRLLSLFHLLKVRM